MSQITPRLSLLTPEQICDIHEMVVTILEKTGIRVDDPGARDLLEKALGTAAKDNRIMIPRETIDWAIDASPGSIDVCNRDGSQAFTLDSRDIGQTIFRHRSDQPVLPGPAHR